MLYTPDKSKRPASWIEIGSIIIRPACRRTSTLTRILRFRKRFEEALRDLPGVARVYQHGSHAELRAARRAQPRLCGMAAAEVRPGARRPRRIDDAQYSAISHRPVRRAARRHGRSSTPIPCTRRASSSISCRTRARRPSSSSRISRTCCSRCSPRTGLKQVLVTGVGDMLGSPKRLDRELRAASRAQAGSGLEHPRFRVLQERSWAAGSGSKMDRGRVGSGGHRFPAIHRRHHRRRQGGGSYPPQHGGERAAGDARGSGRRCSRRRPRRDHRAAAVSHLLAHR